LSVSKLRAAIEDRDASVIQEYFFEQRPLRLKDSVRREDPLWDYKDRCPDASKESAASWAYIAGDVLAFHNSTGGVLLFGIDNYFDVTPELNPKIDSKLFNDQIRKYVGDRIWVAYNEIPCKGGHIGLAIIPPRGIEIARAKADAPFNQRGTRYFQALDICVRTGDETKVYRGERAEKYLRDHGLPISNAQYIVYEPNFKILRPEYERFIQREQIESELWKSISDPRCYVTHITGLGGAGKTAIALWFTLQLYDRKKFDFIITASARDRALAKVGIVQTTPTLSSYELLLDQIADSLGVASDLLGYSCDDKEEMLLGLLKGVNALLVLDNLETVDDERIFSFIDKLPTPVRTIATSRVQRIHKSVYPIKIDSMTLDESLRLFNEITHNSSKAALLSLSKTEKKKIVEHCLRIPLAIEWVVARSSSAPDVLENAQELSKFSASLDELLEFSFRRIYDQPSQHGFLASSIRR
jgi:NB-ARC domain/Putative DNA-binding domain